MRSLRLRWCQSRLQEIGPRLPLILAILRAQPPRTLPQIVFLKSEIELKSISGIERKTQRGEHSKDTSGTESMEIGQVAENSWVGVSAGKWHTEGSQGGDRVAGGAAGGV